MPGSYTESNYENAVLELFRNMGYTHVYGPDVSRDFACPFYEAELLSALCRLNPALPEDAISDALSKLQNL